MLPGWRVARILRLLSIRDIGQGLVLLDVRVVVLMMVLMVIVRMITVAVSLHILTLLLFWRLIPGFPLVCCIWMTCTNAATTCWLCTSFWSHRPLLGALCTTDTVSQIGPWKKLINIIALGGCHWGGCNWGASSLMYILLLLQLLRVLVRCTDSGCRICRCLPRLLGNPLALDNSVGNAGASTMRTILVITICDRQMSTILLLWCLIGLMLLKLRLCGFERLDLLLNKFLSRQSNGSIRHHARA